MNTSSAFLRPATLADAPGIAQVHVDSWAAAYRELMPPEAIASRPVDVRIAQWSEWLEQHEPGSIWVAEVQGQVCGFVSGGPTRGEWQRQAPGEIYALYLMPGAFGQGLGRLLFEQMRTELAARGFERHWVWVLETNLKARAFYEKMGGVWAAQSEIQIGEPPLAFQEVAYLFSGSQPDR